MNSGMPEWPTIWRALARGPGPAPHQLSDLEQMARLPEPVPWATRDMSAAPLAGFVGMK